MDGDFETAVANATLMVQRRGYTESVAKLGTLKDVGHVSISRNPSTSDLISTYFINRDEKVSVKKMREIIREIEVVQKSIKKRVIIIHDLSFTPESKHTVQVNNVFVFEVFTYDEMMYDPLAIIDNPYELYTGPPIKEIGKIPKISDIITKYMAFPVGSVIVVKDDRTGIPFLYVVLKSICDDTRKK